MNNHILKHGDSLPDIPESTARLYLDLETGSGCSSRGGVDPYTSDFIAGIAVTWDEHPDAYYVPIKHTEQASLFSDGRVAENMDWQPVRDWLRALLADPNRAWINHNIKFDAHFVHCWNVDVKCRLVDTLPLAKLVDQQRRLTGYGLKPLAERWLGMDPDAQDLVKEQLLSLKTKDYAEVDIDTMGEYACTDVRMNRSLWHHILRLRDDEHTCKAWATEYTLTKHLFNIERRGLRVDREQMDVWAIEYQTKIAQTEQRLQQEMSKVGKVVDPNSSTQLNDLFFAKLRLPVISVTKTNNPSVDAATLKAWQRDETLAEHHELIRCVEELRRLQQFVSLYLEGWRKDMDVRSVIRPKYIQTVRTGRMSCSSPNIQQLNSEAKRLIRPAQGNAFLSLDYSQIEFRVLGVVCNDTNIITAYQNNPDTDFHSFAAELCDIDRQQAKIINFGIAFGMGKAKLERSLLNMGSSTRSPSEVLNTYKQRFPRIFSESRRLTTQAERQGWVRNLYGRKRALDHASAHKALNTVVQGSAADIVKDVVCALESWPTLKEKGISIRAIVHDEVLFEGPHECFDQETVESIKDKMCVVPSVHLPVPLVVSGGMSNKCWKDAT